MPRYSLRQALLLAISAVLCFTILTMWRRTSTRDSRSSSPNPNRKPASKPVNRPRPQHHFRENGFLETNMKGRHPIHDLFQSGQHRWQDMLQRSGGPFCPAPFDFNTCRQSTTLSQAVAEYERRYHRLPPQGFDAWFLTLMLVIVTSFHSLLGGGSLETIMLYWWMRSVLHYPNGGLTLTGVSPPISLTKSIMTLNRI